MIVVIPEGKAEKCFIKRLAAKRGFADRIYVPPKQPGGNTTFQTQIQGVALDIIEGEMTALVLVGDNNGDPTAAFERMKDQVVAAENVDLTPPDDPWTVSEGDPGVAILTLPEAGVNGTLETLIWRAMQPEYEDEAGLAIEYIDQARTGRAGKVSTREKAKFAALVAGTCVDDPSCMIHDMWQSSRGYQHLLADPVFHPIAGFLESL